MSTHATLTGAQLRNTHHLLVDIDFVYGPES
jgi:hypothetical protein